MFYVYSYLREDFSPYYIGKGSGKRAYTKGPKEVKPPKDKTRVKIIKENLTEQEAFELEKLYILMFGRKDLETGILRNKSDGGGGGGSWGNPGGAGGAGGGGPGGSPSPIHGVNGTTNTGGGGGAGYPPWGVGGTGGPGIIAIRYLL